jgi:hypothetical protein
MKDRPNPISRAEQRREKKRQHRSRVAPQQQQQQQQAESRQGEFACIDWGASHWRQFTSTSGFSPPEPSLVTYNKHTGEFKTGATARDAWLPSASLVRFEGLKRLFDEDSGFMAEERARIRVLGLEISIEDVLERWWSDRLGPLMKQVDPRETITVAIAHPAHFSPQSVRNLHDFFAQARHGRSFRVVVSEESTAALHGSRFSGFSLGDIVLVVDGGKSTIVRQNGAARHALGLPSDLQAGLRVSRDNEQRAVAHNNDIREARAPFRRRPHQPGRQAARTGPDRRLQEERRSRDTGADGSQRFRARSGIVVERL